MIIKRSNVLMISEDDIRQLIYEWAIVPDWIKVHVSAKHPAHRYEGELSLYDHNLIFYGQDIKLGKDYELEISLGYIVDVSLNFSELLKSSADPAFGIGGPIPFVVRYEDNQGTRAIYFNTNFNNYITKGDKTNQKWCEEVKKAIDRWKIQMQIGNRVFAPV